MQKSLMCIGNFYGFSVFFKLKKAFSFGAEYLIRFLNQPFGYNSRHKGKDFLLPPNLC